LYRGLSNVNQRIKIIFGDSYGIHVESTVDVGTDVYKKDNKITGKPILRLACFVVSLF